MQELIVHLFIHLFSLFNSSVLTPVPFQSYKFNSFIFTHLIETRHFTLSSSTKIGFYQPKIVVSKVAKSTKVGRRLPELWWLSIKGIIILLTDWRFGVRDSIKPYNCKIIIWNKSTNLPTSCVYIDILHSTRYRQKYRQN